MKFKLIVIALGMIIATTSSAATLVDLSHQSSQFAYASLGNQTQLATVRTEVDFNHTTHVHMQQTVAGVPVWDATSVSHTAKNRTAYANSDQSTLNGILYTGIEKDLVNTPAYALSDAQKTKALQQQKQSYIKNTGISSISAEHEEIKTIIFIDENKQARYAYLISFYVDDHKSGAHRPTAIVDATSLQVYRHWDKVMTIEPKFGTNKIIAGGIGGNKKTGPIIYDGDNGHETGLEMSDLSQDIDVIPGQTAKYSMCLFDNDALTVIDVSYLRPVLGRCVTQKEKHHNAAWLDWDNQETHWLADEVNGGYSPSIDVFYAATVVKNLYQSWYGIPVLTEEDQRTPMKLLLLVHYGRNFENAYWDGEKMTFGDGNRRYYPFTSLDVTAHEISHGFTQQHSNIDTYEPQMAALHESFSDMAAIAAEYFVHGKNGWDIGRNIKKDEGAMRYLDDPTKDGVSIDNLKDFDDTEAHAGAGVFNKAFYLIATSNGWDTHKAFNIMVKANMNYWTSSMKTYTEAACGVVSATQDYKYNIADVRVAFAKVGIDTDGCEVH